VTRQLALLALVLLAAGCRSDGGIDRRDCKQGLDFALHSFSQQTKLDVANTGKTLGSVPGALSDSVPDSVKTMRTTCDLYLDTHAAK
jgi:hypothetical protein